MEIDKDKNIHTYQKYETKVFNSLDRYEKKLISIIVFYRKVILRFIAIIDLFFRTVANLLNKLYKIARYSTIPLHWLWIFITLRKMVEDQPDFMDLPFNKNGAHYWYAKPGEGKSTCVFHKNMEHAYLTGKAAYTTVQMERPRTRRDGTKFVYNQVFDPNELFVEGKQIKAWDKRFNKVVFEEILTQGFNHRLNNQSSYKDIVIPMIASMSAQRHQGIEIFDFISQLPKTDIQIMQMLTYYHRPKIKKKFDYVHWLQTGKFRFTIKGWKIKTYEIMLTGAADYEIVPYKTYFYPCTLHDDMEFFEQFNLKKNFDSLETMKGVTMS